MLYSSEFPDGFRAALQLRGFQTGTGRQPKSQVQHEQLEKLTGQLQCILSQEGFADQPIGGCQQASPMSASQIERIVQDVLKQLGK
jgi:4-hydroxy-tetrahydrodipicolinate synthase